MNIFLQNLTRLGRVQKKIIVGFLDYCSLSVAFLLALLSNEISITQIDESLLSYILILPITTVLIFYLFGVYSSVLRYLDFSLLTKLLETGLCRGTHSTPIFYLLTLRQTSRLATCRPHRTFQRGPRWPFPTVRYLHVLYRHGELLPKQKNRGGEAGASSKEFL